MADKKELGLVTLIAIVVSSMIGSGVDGLPQNMAAHSALGPILIAWFICGFGIFFIARTFIILSNIRPDLQSGIYMYAREGFGPFIAFIVAWGYWLMTIFSNVAFAIMIMDTLNYFMPGEFKGGNNIPSIIGASILIWGFNFLVLSGVKVAGLLNTIGTFAKIIPLIIFVFIVAYFLNFQQLGSDFWGHSAAKASNDLGSLSSQILSPFYVALWCFIGIEGAVVLSGRAKNTKDIGKATFWGFVISLVICILISVLPFGVFTQQQLSVIPTPSTAGILKSLVGDWGEWIINIGILVSILSSWLAWTIICAEIPMVAAVNKTFPKIFAKKNKNESASVSLWISSIIMQIVILLVYFAQNAWLTLLAISAITVIPAYFASTAYLFKISINKEYDRYASKGRIAALISSFIGAIFCLVMVYAINIKYVIFIPVILTLGIPLYIFSRREEHSKFSKSDKVYLAILLLADILAISVYLIFIH